MNSDENASSTSDGDRHTRMPTRQFVRSGSTKTEDVSADLELLDLIRIRWRLIVATTLFGTVIGVGAAFLMTPVYRASVLLMPTQTAGRAGMLNGVFSELGSMSLLGGFGIGQGNHAVTTEAIALLRSRRFIEQFIQQNNLMPVLFHKDWNVKDERWSSSVTYPPTIWKGYQLFVGRVMSVRQDSKTDLVTLNVDWTNRWVAANWANALVAKVNEQIREREISQADQTIRYVNQELKAADTVELRQALYAMLENEVKIKAIATVRKQYAFEVLDPAAPPDPGTMLRPRKKLYIVSGPVLGFGLSLAVALILEGNRRRFVERARHG